MVGPEDASGKVAPGLSATFAVLFTPQDYKVLVNKHLAASISTVKSQVIGFKTGIKQQGF